MNSIRAEVSRIQTGGSAGIREQGLKVVQLACVQSQVVGEIESVETSSLAGFDEDRGGPSSHLSEPALGCGRTPASASASLVPVERGQLALDASVEPLGGEAQFLEAQAPRASTDVESLRDQTCRADVRHRSRRRDSVTACDLGERFSGHLEIGRESFAPSLDPGLGVAGPHEPQARCVVAA